MVDFLVLSRCSKPFKPPPRFLPPSSSLEEDESSCLPDLGAVRPVLVLESRRGSTARELYGLWCSSRATPGAPAVVVGWSLLAPYAPTAAAVVAPAIVASRPMWESCSGRVPVMPAEVGAVPDREVGPVPDTEVGPVPDREVGPVPDTEGVPVAPDRIGAPALASTCGSSLFAVSVACGPGVK